MHSQIPGCCPQGILRYAAPADQCCLDVLAENPYRLAYATYFDTGISTTFNFDLNYQVCAWGFDRMGICCACAVSRTG